MKCLVVGVVRNISATIQDDIIRLTNALERFEEIHWLLIESNSTDDSIKTLGDLKKKIEYFEFQSIESNNETRTSHLARARNQYLNDLQKYRDRGIKYVVVADFNNLNNKLTAKSVNSCWESKIEWDACCANSEKRYYDIWALRHPNWSPNDCWKDLEFYKKYIKFSELALYRSVNSRMIKIPTDSDWIQVQSAFGGLAIYKIEIMQRSKYKGINKFGESICEHVAFNEKLNEEGFKIYINPKMINMSYTDHSIRSLKIFSLIRIGLYLPKVLRKLRNKAM